MIAIVVGGTVIPWINLQFVELFLLSRGIDDGLGSALILSWSVRLLVGPLLTGIFTGMALSRWHAGYSPGASTLRESVELIDDGKAEARQGEDPSMKVIGNTHFMKIAGISATLAVFVPLVPGLLFALDLLRFRLTSRFSGPFLLNPTPFFFAEPPPGLLYFPLAILLIASTAGIVAALGFFRPLRQAGIFAWIAVVAFVAAKALGIVLNILFTKFGFRDLELGNTTLLASGVRVFFSIASLRVHGIYQKTI